MQIHTFYEGDVLKSKPIYKHTICKVHIFTLFAMLFESQSSPSYSPSPEVAQVLWMYLQHPIHNEIPIEFNLLTVYDHVDDAFACAGIWVCCAERERDAINKLFTSGVGGGSEGQAYQLFQQHSLHLEDLACLQTPTAQHPSTHPSNPMNSIYQRRVRKFHVWHFTV